MSVVIRLNAAEERKALPILLRHSPGIILPGRTYVLSPEAVRALQDAGVRFTRVGGETDPPSVPGVPAGERV